LFDLIFLWIFCIILTTQCENIENYQNSSRGVKYFKQNPEVTFPHFTNFLEGCDQTLNRAMFPGFLDFPTFYATLNGPNKNIKLWFYWALYMTVTKQP
jgi:hypothetical protein